MHTWILFLASSRWWISFGQSCITVVSCLSWQSRYFSPASMYSLHPWICRLVTPALPLPLTRPPVPFSRAPDRGPLRGSADRRSSRRSRRRREVNGRMVGKEGRPLSNQVSVRRLLREDLWQDSGSRSQLCVRRGKTKGRGKRSRFLFKSWQWFESRVHILSSVQPEKITKQTH